jgi:hypothetical protein
MLRPEELFPHKLQTELLKMHCFILIKRILRCVGDVEWVEVQGRGWAGVEVSERI